MDKDVRNIHGAVSYGEERTPPPRNFLVVYRHGFLDNPLCSLFNGIRYYDRLPVPHRAVIGVLSPLPRDVLFESDQRSFIDRV
jgi:hypothetical protein